MLYFTYQNIDSLLKQPNLKGIKYLFLVGGFAESKVLQSAIRENFDEKDGVSVRIPPRPSLAVISGAVQYVLFSHL